MTSWMDLIKKAGKRPVGWHLERFARLAAALHLAESLEERGARGARGVRGARGSDCDSAESSAPQPVGIEEPAP